MTRPFVQNRVIVRGAGDVASGVIRRLSTADFEVIALEKSQPDFVRRYVCFAEAFYRKEFSIDGITAVLVHSVEEAVANIGDRRVPLLIDPDADSLSDLSPLAVVDARMLKKNIDTGRDMAPVVIGLGPGFTAGENCHAAVETMRGGDLGRVMYTGAPRDDTGVPASVKGVGIRRLLRSPADGTFTAHCEIGDTVKPGQILGEIAGVEVAGRIGGVVRGLIHDGLTVSVGQKIGDIDPRGVRDYCYEISDKADAIGKGVLEAIHTLQAKVIP